MSKYIRNFDEWNVSKKMINTNNREVFGVFKDFT
jgi:hypothetical protein